MALPWANLGQPYATPATGWGAPGAAFNGMAPMPGQAAPGGLPSIPPIPPPCQVAPNLCQTAQSVPVSGSASNILPIADIPPPHMAAPWVYWRKPAAPPNPGWGQQQRPMPPQQQPQRPPQPQQQPQQPQQQQQPAQPPQPKAPDPPQDTGGLNNEVINSLNERLNDALRDEVREGAAMDLFKILKASPGLANNPQYKAHVDAFLEKILKDPNPMVRAAGELIMQMGYAATPSESVKKQLKSLAERKSLISENYVASDILGRMASGTLKPPPPPPDANASGSPGAPGGSLDSILKDPTFKKQDAALAQQRAGAAGQGQAAQTQQPQSQNQAYAQQPTAPQSFPNQNTTLQQPMAVQAPQMQQPMPQQGGYNAVSSGYPANMGYAPQQAGNRLNMLSSPQQAPMAYPGFPQTGQQLNYQEGYR